MTKCRILFVEDEMDIYELVQFLMERNGHEMFLAVNGHYGASYRKRALDAGCNDYIAKPIDMVELVRVMDQALKH